MYQAVSLKIFPMFFIMKSFTRTSCFVFVFSTLIINFTHALDASVIKEKTNLSQKKETLIGQLQVDFEELNENLREQSEQRRREFFREYNEQRQREQWEQWEQWFSEPSFTNQNQCDNSATIENDECTDEQESFSIGKIKFRTDPNDNQVLKVRSSGESSLDSYNFVGKVGGVNFEEIAIPHNTIKNKSIELSYDANALDGQRLVIKIGNQTIRPNIPDWILIPVANFANSEYTAVVSLFGEGPDPERFYYIKFHPAFKNTLIGLRLLQADILLINPQENISLPEKNGQIILGHGEVLPKKNYLINELDKIRNIINKYKYTAWVLTDIEEPTSFSVSNGDLKIKSSPYYYFWRRNESSINNYQSKVNIYNRKVNEYNEFITNLKSQISKYNTQVARYNADNSSVSIFLLNQSKLDIDNQKLKAKKLEEELKRLKLDLEERVFVDSVPKLTDELKKQSNIFRKINPLVFKTVDLTVGYTSLFRYIKLNHNNSWKTFMESISNVEIKPVVETPTEMFKKI